MPLLPYRGLDSTFEIRMQAFFIKGFVAYSETCDSLLFDYSQCFFRIGVCRHSLSKSVSGCKCTYCCFFNKDLTTYHSATNFLFNVLLPYTSVFYDDENQKSKLLEQTVETGSWAMLIRFCSKKAYLYLLLLILKALKTETIAILVGITENFQYN